MAAEEEASAFTPTPSVPLQTPARRDHRHRETVDGQELQAQTVSPSAWRSNLSPQRPQVAGNSCARTKSARISVIQKARYGTTSAGEFMSPLIGRSGPVV